jgi:hypothetical protein
MQEQNRMAGKVSTKLEPTQASADLRAIVKTLLKRHVRVPCSTALPNESVPVDGLVGVIDGVRAFRKASDDGGEEWCEMWVKMTHAPSKYWFNSFDLLRWLIVDDDDAATDGGSNAALEAALESATTSTPPLEGAATTATTTAATTTTTTTGLALDAVAVELSDEASGCKYVGTVKRVVVGFAPM